MFGATDVNSSVRIMIILWPNEQRNKCCNCLKCPTYLISQICWYLDCIFFNWWQISERLLLMEIKLYIVDIHMQCKIMLWSNNFLHGDNQLKKVCIEIEFLYHCHFDFFFHRKNLVRVKIYFEQLNFEHVEEIPLTSVCIQDSKTILIYWSLSLLFKFEGECSSVCVCPYGRGWYRVHFLKGPGNSRLFVFSLTCYLSLIFKHSDTKWD